MRDLSNASSEAEQELRNRSYDVQTLNLLEEGVDPRYALPRLFQIFSLLKYRLAELFQLCAVNQPPVEYYKRVVAYTEDESGEGHEAVERFFAEEPAHIFSEGNLEANIHASAVNGSLPLDAIAHELEALGLDHASLGNVLGCIHRVAARLTGPHSCYGECIYFGNLTRGGEARALREMLAREHGQCIWQQPPLRSFADLGKGPGVGHATHAMGKQGRVLTFSILPHEHGSPGGHTGGYPSGYVAHNAYANVLALAGYDVVAEIDGGKPTLKAGCGHPGMAVLVRMPRNDAAARAELERVLRRCADVVKMEACP